MWRAGVGREQPTGLAAYVVVEVLAKEVLRLGQTVIVDAVNDAPEARQQWERLGAEPRYIEVICSDQALHRERLERRRRGIAGFDEPTWSQVEERRKNFEAWHGERFTVDSVNDLGENVKLVLNHLRSSGPATTQYE